MEKAKTARKQKSDDEKIPPPDAKYHRKPTVSLNTEQDNVHETKLALFIQKTWRGYLVRKRFKELMDKTNVLSSTSIQSALFKISEYYKGL
jgi:hypothetical protein